VAQEGTSTTAVAVSALSHVGLVRDSNEDSLVVGPWTLCATQTESPQTLVFPVGTPLVVAVADGLGGHPGGDLASSLVVRLLARAGPSLDGEEAIRDVLEQCNRAVYAAAAGNRQLLTMGTTVAGIVVTDEQVITFNVGDSRVYQVLPDELRQVSVDDRPSDGGALSRHTVLQTLGGSVDLSTVEPHVTSSPRPADARYLICTDGLGDVVPTGELARILHDHEDGRAAFELWKAAIEAGGPDNVTLAVTRLSTGRKAPAESPSGAV
jgi:PPM family protein phosphatase